MTTILQIYEEDSTLLFNMNTTGQVLLNYDTQSPDLRTEENASVLEDGSDVLYARQENVVEVIHLLFHASTADGVQAIKESLESVVDTVNAALENFEPYYFIRYRPDSETVTWRSKLVHMRVVPAEDRMDRNAKLVMVGTTNTFFDVIDVEITRAPWWESTTESELALTNYNGSNVTGGITVNNRNDGTHSNYVQIAAAAIDGSIPAPLRITLADTVNHEPARISNVYVAKNARFTPNSLAHVIEAENASWQHASFTDSADANASNGYVVQANTVNLSSETLVLRWTITGAQLAYCGFRWFHVVASFRSLTVGTRIRLKTNLFGITNLADTPLYVYDGPVGGWVIDLGLIRLPPYEIGSYSPGDIYLDMYMQNTREGGTITAHLDFIQLTPCEPEDGFLLFQPQGYHLPYGCTLIWESGRRKLLVNTGSGHGNWYNAVGTPIYARPGKLCRLYFLINKNTGGNIPEWNTTVRVFYRPRRRFV